MNFMASAIFPHVTNGILRLRQELWVTWGLKYH